MELEIWKNVPGFEGIYQISSIGRLKSFKRNTEGRILLNNNKTGDYFGVVIRWRDKDISGNLKLR
jgi:hypothetical protein